MVLIKPNAAVPESLRRGGCSVRISHKRECQKLMITRCSPQCVMMGFFAPSPTCFAEPSGKISVNDILKTLCATYKLVTLVLWPARDTFLCQLQSHTLFPSPLGGSLANTHRWIEYCFSHCKLKTHRQFSNKNMWCALTCQSPSWAVSVAGSRQSHSTLLA